jgi:hypothetical protein
MADVDSIYDALSFAETGGEDYPWIRTRVQPAAGSTAFGPVQITKGLLEGAIKNKMLSPESEWFAKTVMLPMQGLMLKYGGKDMRKGYEQYDYGQTGGFDPVKYQEAYRKLATELISKQLKGDDVYGFLKTWRGATPEKEYRQRFDKVYVKPKVKAK